MLAAEQWGTELARPMWGGSCSWGSPPEFVVLAVGRGEGRACRGEQQQQHGCTTHAGRKGRIWRNSSLRTQKARAGRQQQGGGRTRGWGLACRQEQNKQKAKGGSRHLNKYDPGFVPPLTPSWCFVGFTPEGTWYNVAGWVAGGETFVGHPPPAAAKWCQINKTSTRLVEPFHAAGGWLCFAEEAEDKAFSGYQWVFAFSATRHTHLTASWNTHFRSPPHPPLLSMVLQGRKSKLLLGGLRRLSKDLLLGITTGRINSITECGSLQGPCKVSYKYLSDSSNSLNKWRQMLEMAAFHILSLWHGELRHGGHLQRASPAGAAHLLDF